MRVGLLTPSARRTLGRMALRPRPARRPAPRTVALAVATLLLASPAAGVPAAGAASDDRVPTSREVPPVGRGSQAERVGDDPQVLAISIDALNPNAVRRLGRDGAPHLWRILDEGASTLNARTSYELTVTLPNHTSMVTGRRIAKARGGHGVTWNTDRPGTTVQRSSGDRDVSSVFETAHDAGLSTALFAAKTKFSLFQRSWPDGLDRVTIKEEQDTALMKAVRRDLLRRDRAFTFWHIGDADKTGHAKGFMSPAYLRAVKRIDGLVGKVLDAADRKPQLDDLTIVLTADHGGLPGSTKHSAQTRRANYTIPFAVWGPGVAPADLYRINPRYQNPGKARPGYGKPKQPVRNGMVANLALDLLGVDAVPGSQLDTRQNLRVVRR
ncbi:MAG: hypothetical protein CMH83_13895 [Nocardioides sp.]|nr:hypothetical protein [Nocardioides sp.]